MTKFLPRGECKWIDRKSLGYNKYNTNSSKVCVFEVDREYPGELLQLHNDFSLEMLSNYQIQ